MWRLERRLREVMQPQVESAVQSAISQAMTQLTAGERIVVLNLTVNVYNNLIDTSAGGGGASGTHGGNVHVTINGEPQP